MAAWKALWSGANGEACRERLSVAELGYEEAFKKAVAKRFKEIGQKAPEVRMPSEKVVMRKWWAR